MHGCAPIVECMACDSGMCYTGVRACRRVCVLFVCACVCVCVRMYVCLPCPARAPPRAHFPELLFRDCRLVHEGRRGAAFLFVFIRVLLHVHVCVEISTKPQNSKTTKQQNNKTTKQACERTHVYACTRQRMHMQTYTRTRTHSHDDASVYACKRTHAHAHMRANRSYKRKRLSQVSICLTRDEATNRSYGPRSG